MESNVIAFPSHGFRERVADCTRALEPILTARASQYGAEVLWAAMVQIMGAILHELWTRDRAGAWRVLWKLQRMMRTS